MSDLFPRGRYSAAPREAQFGYTKDSKPSVAVTFEVADGEMAGQEITWFGYFTEKTTARTMESLRHCGWVGDDISNLGTLDQLVEIIVDHEQYNGEWQAKVKWVNQPGGGRFKMAQPMDANALKQFAAEMRGAARASADGSPKRPAASPPSSGVDFNKRRAGSGYGGSRVDERNPPPGDDSDIPF